MEEDWHDDEYLVLLTDQEALPASERYGIAAMLRGYGIIGLRGSMAASLEGSNGTPRQLFSGAIPVWVRTSFGFPTRNMLRRYGGGMAYSVSFTVAIDFVPSPMR